MKKLNVMIYAETLEALCKLPNEDIGVLVRNINDWNNGRKVTIENPFHNAIWMMILPDLERNKETYNNIVERNTTNGKKGGRPKKDNNQENPVGILGNPNEPKKPNYNCNYNSIDNSSKDELSNLGQHTSPDGDDVVSKGLEKLESIFPPRKNAVDIDTINLWNSFTQEEKQTLIKKASVYIREELKNSEGVYIKQMSKWLKEQKEKGVNTTPKNLKNKTSNDDPRLFKLVHGQLWVSIEKLTNSSTKADELYKKHNRKDLYKDAQEMWAGIVNEINQNK